MAATRKEILELEEEGDLDAAKFHGGEVLQQMFHQVNIFRKQFHIFICSPSLAIVVLFGVCGFFLWHLAGEDGKYETKREKVEAEKANKRR